MPSNALIVRKSGTQVAVVDAQNKVHLLPITVGRDYGNNIDVAQGLQGGEQVILNPSDSVTDGDEVHIVKDATPEGAKKAENADTSKSDGKISNDSSKGKP
jgi:hypothetical protein